MENKHPPIQQQITFLSTKDLKATHQFYNITLGLEQVLDQGGCRIYRLTNESFLGFCQREDDFMEEKALCCTFVTDQVDEWHKHLVQNGVEVEDEPKENPNYNIYHFFFRDPNGYLMEVQKFLSPDWPQ